MGFKDYDLEARDVLKHLIFEFVSARPGATLIWNSLLPLRHLRGKNDRT